MNDIFKGFDQFLSDINSELAGQIANDAIGQLAGEVSVSDFTKKANELFKKHDVRNKSGELVVVSNPANALEELEIVSLRGELNLTEAEDRWLRANSIYGKDILGKIGFKYTNR
jgi:hypothetical protein